MAGRGSSILGRAIMITFAIVILFLIAEAIDPNLIPQQACARTCHTGVDK